MPMPTLRTSLRSVLLATTLLAAGVAGTTLPPAPAHAEVPMQGYADLVARISPAVVFIEVTSQSKEASGPAGGPMEEFLRRFGEMNPQFRIPDGPQEERVMHGLGSGFLISEDGIVVTNNHVVENATEMNVKLQDGREFRAEIVGTDPMTDIAVIRLKDARDLPFVEFGDSEKLRVGDAVVAVGNPFGLGGTVTSGIVSAMGRNINSGPYDDYIQTDAAINQGNSGGPLFDTSGKVVGMNTAIFSPSGGSVGIGFSIPADTVREVVAQLQEKGTVSRGWLGVTIQPMTPDIARALGIEGREGALVAEVQQDSPAAEAGIRSGDVITAVNGREVGRHDSLPRLIAAIPNGERAELTIERDGREREVTVTIGELSPDRMQMAAATREGLGAPLGVGIEPLAPALARQLGLSPDLEGVVVTSVDPSGPNADRLMPGDVIEEAAGRPVASPRDLAAAVSESRGKGVLLLKVLRQGNPVYVGAELASS
ncbi:DegQ family serine endoprotease [Cereibacter sphaeroides]|uniref:DegQ family serine endoprotease n=1 Tax=Cereibacter sphaeroides TaxID=1063 RepID=UPI001F3BA890|nr:DegQ family serine endoprotease [Cereibacter sphaeroides]MCE6960623.1 DegQ family serine endoprotease [Cereibacter sphaeroides]MCE6973275.1 DegQ family serine endoprotease [Cereibacter sphaeroides]